MSQSDFQARLDRLNPESASQTTFAQQRSSDAHGSSVTKFGKKWRSALLTIGPAAAVMALGFQTLKLVVSKYDYIHDTHGIGVAIGASLFATLLLVTGVFLFHRASKRFAASGSEPDHPTPKRVASNRAKTLWSLVGLLLGAFACYEMFLAAAARQFETEIAEKVAAGGVFLAAFLALFTSLFLIASMIWRGRGLARVTVFFWAGGILTYLAMGLLNVDLKQHEAFAMYLQ